MSDGNARKQYIENGYYHIYNRGVEKRLIFLDSQDYGVFLSYLNDYLTPKDEKSLTERLSDPNTSYKRSLKTSFESELSNSVYKEKDKIIKLLHLNNFTDEITTLAYCLMPNHFHFFIKQKSADTVDKFID